MGEPIEQAQDQSRRRAHLVLEIVLEIVDLIMRSPLV
jgi:hypothetical protein